MRCFRHYPFGVKGFKCEPITIVFLNRTKRNIHDPQLFKEAHKPEQADG